MSEQVGYFTLLYVSDATASAGAIASIARQSRMRNRREDITGLLIFDGACFAQLVEGPKTALVSLVERLEVDPRHVCMEVLSFSHSGIKRRFPNWLLGYLLVDDEGMGVRNLRTKIGADALSSFEALLPHVDADLDGLANA